ncbi:MAG: hypothetical protein IT531_17785 [Burkholderiales bacterium]|nr:hypothetical protein [Burkholderiales bacterium]
MTESVLTLDQVRAMAADLRLDRFNDAQLEELTRATNAARARRAKLGIERLSLADEPAHVFRLDDEEPV